jgi:hypothetical protein
MSSHRPKTYRRRPQGQREEGGSSSDKSLAVTLKALSLDDASVERIQKLPNDAGILLATAGFLGIIMPGVLGMPFLVLGGLLMVPKSKRKAEHWLSSGQSPKLFKGSIRQINRFLDDLENRYPYSR